MDDTDRPTFRWRAPLLGPPGGLPNTSSSTGTFDGDLDFAINSSSVNAFMIPENATKWNKLLSYASREMR